MSVLTDKDVENIKHGEAVGVMTQAVSDECSTCKWGDRTWDDMPCDCCTMGGRDHFYIPKDAVSLAKVLEIIDNEALMLQLGGYGKVYTEPLKERIKALVEVTE